MITYSRIWGTISIIVGILTSLSVFKIIKMESDELIGTALILLAVASVFLSFTRNRRDFLFFFTSVFMIGIIFLTKSHFEIIESRGLIFSSILFISGSGFLILFSDNMKEKVFLYNGIFFFALGYLSITLLRDLGIIGFANSLANTAEEVWPVLLILFGLIIFINRKK